MDVLQTFVDIVRIRERFRIRCIPPSGTILTSMNVRSLYTNIPHNDGIEACREAWDLRAVKEPPTEYLVQLLTFVLKHNNITFNGEHFFAIRRKRYGNKDGIFIRQHLHEET